ncbi:MAG: hypothetical protein MI864_28490 [Pseudomonadales bacterium]|nr:hypothetical protein [Pseudomonadales bacterium]
MGTELHHIKNSIRYPSVNLSNGDRLDLPVTSKAGKDTLIWAAQLNHLDLLCNSTPHYYHDDRSLNSTAFADAIRNNRRRSTLGLALILPTAHEGCNTLPPGPKTRSLETLPVSISRKSLDALLKEIRLMGTLLTKHQAVSYLFLHQNISRSLSPEELTELMFNLSKCFSLDHSKDARNVIELDINRLDDSLIPLLKGLGFNHICFTAENIPDRLASLQALRDSIDLIRAYDFSTISFRLDYKNATGRNSRTDTLNRVTTLLPDRICLPELLDIDFHDKSNFTVKPSETKQMQNTLTRARYHNDGFGNFGRGKQSRKDLLTGPEKQNWHLDDLITLGLGGCSIVDNLFAQNCSQFSEYLQTLADNQLPFHQGGYITHTR